MPLSNNTEIDSSFLNLLINLVVSRRIASPPPPNEQTSIFSFGIFATLTFLVLACTITGADATKKPKWWPLFTLIFYAIAGIPYAFCPVIASGDMDSKSAWLSFGDFLVSVVVTCIFGFPCILLQTGAIQGIHLFFCIVSGLCALVTAGYMIHMRHADDY